MKKLIAIGFTVSILVGCQSTAPTYTGNGSTSAESCNFAGISGTSFTPTAMTRRYITNTFNSVPDSYDPQLSNKDYFAPLQTESFKFTGKTIPKKLASRFKKEDRVEIDEKPYVFSGFEWAEVVTESCKVYWYERGNYVKTMKEGVVKSDGTDFTIADYKSFFGEKNFREFVVAPAEVKRDKFKETITIRGDYDDGILFRAWGSTKTNKLLDNTVQLYADVKFRENWAFLDSAYDEDANKRKLTKIDSDTDCSTSSLGLGCILTETVGIEIPISYLETKPNGFEIKVSGKSESIIKVKGYQVRQILDGVKPFI
ncbi:hypothetical protein [Vibrio diabolicus]|uniref:hypothetical protein n=1 Tax=Vibrio diabolicus TaxID=50719 RepID=UPI00211B1DA8|nr:hypothetical protein [Vibrio diabolicus]ELA9389658.1 hypothetical protein [Vibrio parahaemolyticus]MCG6221521.1 hypothetical protein [Vibrio diabolicus]